MIYLVHCGYSIYCVNINYLITLRNFTNGTGSINAQYKRYPPRRKISSSEYEYFVSTWELDLLFTDIRNDVVIFGKRFILL